MLFFHHLSGPTFVSTPLMESHVSLSFSCRSNGASLKCSNISHVALPTLVNNLVRGSNCGPGSMALLQVSPHGYLHHMLRSYLWPFSYYLHLQARPALCELCELTALASMIHSKLANTSCYPMFCCCTGCCISPAAIIVTATTIIKLDIYAGVYNLQRAFTHIISLSLIWGHVISLSVILQWLLLLTGWHPVSLPCVQGFHGPGRQFSRWLPLQPLHLTYHFMFQEHQTVRSSLHTHHPFSYLSCLGFAGPVAYMSFLIFPSSFLPTLAMPNLSFCIWLISSSILSFRLIHAVAYVRISYPCKDE